MHTHLLDASLVGLLAARLARVPAAIFTGHHSHEIPLHDRRVLTLVDRLCARSLSDAVISPSPQMARTLHEVHGVPVEKLAVIVHGFELEELGRAGADGGRVRAELALEDRLVLTSVGRIYWIKNQGGLVRAFARVADDFPDTVLVLVGGGDETGLLDLCRQLGVHERVRLLGPRDDVAAVLAATDLFVHPALAESFGMVVVEAMAAGLPVVSTPVGIAPDLVADGESGLLAADGSPEALASALRRALELQSRWPDMGAEAQRRAQRFRARDMVAQYEELYLHLVNGRRCG